MTEPAAACEAWHPNQNFGIECHRERHGGDPNHEGHVQLGSRRVAVRWTDARNAPTPDPKTTDLPALLADLERHCATVPMGDLAKLWICGECERAHGVQQPHPCDAARAHTWLEHLAGILGTAGIDPAPAPGPGQWMTGSAFTSVDECTGLAAGLRHLTAAVATTDADLLRRAAELADMRGDWLTGLYARLAQPSKPTDMGELAARLGYVPRADLERVTVQRDQALTQARSDAEARTAIVESEATKLRAELDETRLAARAEAQLADQFKAQRDVLAGELALRTHEPELIQLSGISEPRCGRQRCGAREDDPVHHTPARVLATPEPLRVAAPGSRAEYKRLMAERARLIVGGVDPAELNDPIQPRSEPPLPDPATREHRHAGLDQIAEQDAQFGDYPDAQSQPDRPTCQQPVWDGQYQFTCGSALVDGQCLGKHGRQQPPQSGPETPDAR